jgi:serine/threonine-protein kinase RsbW
MMMKFPERGAIELDIPSSPQYVSLARLITSSIARSLNFSEEKIDDLKIAVSEMCTNAIVHCDHRLSPNTRIKVRYMPGDDSITIEVKDKGPGFDPSCVRDFEDGRSAGKGFGIPLIKSLVDEFELETGPESGTTVRITKFDHPEKR